MNKIIKILIIIISIISAISCSNNNQSSNKESDSNVIRVATPGKHYLFSYVKDDNKTFEGYDIDVWEEIGKRLGKKIEWHQYSFEGCLGAVDSQKVDTATQQISITPARMDKFYFSEPYFLSPYKLYVAETNNSINKIEDMYGKKLGLTLADAGHEYITRLDPNKQIDIVSYTSDASIAIPNHVESGKLDASTQAVIVFDKMKEESNAKVKLVGDVLYTEINSFPYPKTEKGKKLCDEVSKVIVEMREDGTLEKLAIKWFGYNPMEGLDAKTELEKFLNTL